VGIASFMGGSTTISQAVVQSARTAFRLAVSELQHVFNQGGSVCQLPGLRQLGAACVVRAFHALRALVKLGLVVVFGVAELRLQELGLGIGFLLERVHALLGAMQCGVQAFLGGGELGLDFGFGCTRGV
jgi:hypothetical protein